MPNPLTPLPFGEQREHPVDCQRGDWVTKEAVPRWTGRKETQAFRPPEASRRSRAWIFLPVLQATSAGEEVVWKRVI